MNEFLEQFLIEARDLAEQAMSDLLALEESPDDHDRLDGVFRGFHTLKGAAGIMEFQAMSQVLHAAEDRLSAARNGDHPVTADLVGDCLACLDLIVQWLDATEAAGDLPDVPPDVAAAMALRFGQPDAPPVAPTQDVSAWRDALLARHPAEARRARAALRYVPDPGCFFRGEDPLGFVARLPGLLTLELTPQTPWPAPDKLDPFASNLVIIALTADSPAETAELFRAVSSQVQIGAIADEASGEGHALPPDARAVLEEQLLLVAEGEADAAAGRLGAAGEVAVQVLHFAGWTEAAQSVQDALARSQQAADPAHFIAALQTLLHPAPAESAPPAGPGPGPGPSGRALRVDVERIDALVKLTGELTVVKNALGYAARLAQNRTDPSALAQTLKDQHVLLDRLVGELQQSVLGIRVLSFRHVFQHFPKLVRDMARTLGKPVRLAMEGETTEADKAIVEALFEPLLHVIRNALDHGVEMPEDRRAAGKPPTATVTLRAYREGEAIVVVVSDDGGGIDAAKIRQVAAQRSIASIETLAGMEDDAVAELIFAPGFSTAATVTGVSGRGVGMDAVRAAVGRMGGRVSLSTQANQGTSVFFTLPFTVMMSRVMTVEAAAQVFGIPFEAVVETVRLPRDRIVRIGAAQAFLFQDQTVPLISLAEGLGLPAGADACGPDANIVVARCAGSLGAVEVDRFGEWLDVMLKPAEGLLAGMSLVAGTSLLGDGRVLIVLNMQEFLQ